MLVPLTLNSRHPKSVVMKAYDKKTADQKRLDRQLADELAR